MSDAWKKAYYDDKDDITRYWELRHEEWLNNPDWANFPRRQAWFHERIGRLLPRLRGDPTGPWDPEASHVLDYGCGVGLYAAPLLDYYDYYQGFDTSISAIKTASDYYWEHASDKDKTRLNFAVYSGGVGGWTVAPDFRGYDLVLSITVLQHQTVPSRLAMIKNIKNLIRPGGMYVGLEWADSFSMAYDMPPIPEREWREAWLPLVIERDVPSEHPEWVQDNVWVAR